MNIVKSAKEFLMRYKLQSEGVYYIELHVDLMIKYGISKPQPKGFDPEIYKTACWLHDIGRFSKKDSLKDRERHRMLGVEIFDKEFANLIQNEKSKQKIRSCVLEHSGIFFSKRYPELITIREADRISFIHPKFTEHYLTTIGKDAAQKKLDNNYKELMSMHPSLYARKIANKWKRLSQELINIFIQKA